VTQFRTAAHTQQLRALTEADAELARDHREWRKLCAAMTDLVELGMVTTDYGADLEIRFSLTDLGEAALESGEVALEFPVPRPPAD
jgi:hypothetical protein